MRAETRKRIIWLIIFLVVLALMIYGFWPRPRQVQTETINRERLEVIVEEEGRTQSREEHLISAPAAGYLRRVELEAGDRVKEEQLLVELEAPRPPELDPRARLEAQAALEGARAGLAMAREEVTAAEATAQAAEMEQRRVERLVEAGAATSRDQEQATARARETAAALEAAQAAVEGAQAEVDRAEARLEPFEDDQATVRKIFSPVTGQILAVHRTSAGHVNPGEPLLLIGDLEKLEVRVDVLSQDAVRMEPGNPARLVQWGREHPLDGEVRRVDPHGFTQVSGLGVEEQRVRVLLDIISPVEERLNLGSGYRVLARFVVWAEEDVLQVPVGALFRREDDWAVFTIEGGRAALRHVQIGEQSGLMAQVLSGLETGEVVVVHPDQRIEEGTRLTPRY